MSPLWLEDSIKQRRRLVEKKYLVAKPKEKMKEPSSGQRPKRRRTTIPKSRADLEINTSDILFSSSQQIGGCDQAGDLADISSPHPSAASKKKRRATVRSRANYSQAHTRHLTSVAMTGAATQEVADILVLDLPGDGVDGGDDLDTPLSVRVARKSKSPLPLGGKQDYFAGQTRFGRAATGSQEQEPIQQPKKTDNKPVAQRFSVRQLHRHPEKPVLLHKGTPLPGALPPKTVEKKGRSIPIPIPPIEVVNSPWSQAEALVASQTDTPGQIPTTQPPPAFKDGKRPTPFTAPRPWDISIDKKTPIARTSKVGFDADVSASQDPEQENNPPVSQPSRFAPTSAVSRLGATGMSVTATKSSSPKSGSMSVSSVDAGINELAQSATRRLRGMRLCPDGKEDGQLTHLVIGQERRTLKVMLAVANGAWLVTPEWITASLEAGKWLPESEFIAPVRFIDGADRARAALEMLDGGRLLEEYDVYTHVSSKDAAANTAAIKRVLAALGANLAPLKKCNLAIVLGGMRKPPGLPRGVPVLREEWLLQAAETYSLPPMDNYAL